MYMPDGEGGGIMLSREITVINPTGLHLRPAGLLAATAMKFSSSIIIKHEQKTIDAKSVINVMAAGIKKGMTVTLICDGADEDKAMAKLTDLIESGLGELTTRY